MDTNGELHSELRGRGKRREAEMIERTSFEIERQTQLSGRKREQGQSRARDPGQKTVSEQGCEGGLCRGDFQWFTSR